MTGGAALAGDYYREVVAPLLATRWPGLPHAAGRLGTGSDVLGLDDDTSRDHDWGLRLTLLVPADLVVPVDLLLAERLPPQWAGRPTRFAITGDPRPGHRVEVATTEQFVASRLGLDPAAGLSTLDWLCLTGQSVLEVTAGPVFVDLPGMLTALRDRLARYPEPVRRYVTAAGWSRIGEALPLLGRCGGRGDEAGSRVLAGAVAATAMHLAFVLDGSWPPYPKWTGTLLARLPIGPALLPALDAALTAGDWQQRQAAVAAALAVLHRAQREAGLPTGAGDPTEPFFDRPFLGIRSEVVDLLLAGTDDDLLRRLPPGLGAVEQWSDAVPLLTDPRLRTAAARLVYRAALAPAAG